MLGSWLRREYAQLLTSGAQLLLLIIGLRLNSRTGWLYCLAAMALISVFAWVSSLYRLRTIRNTPTSRIASAAQGHVELVGRGAQFCDPPVLSQLRHQPCLWSRYRVEERDRSQWKMIDSGETTNSFMLRDESGECVIDPENAEIITRHCDQWLDGDCRYTEWKLIEQDLLYVIGRFRTQRDGILLFDQRQELSQLLADWKADMPTLLARFDLDRDGRLNPDEWELARLAATREVEKVARDFQAQSATSIISQAPDGQLFLISNISQASLSRRYLLWGLAHLTIFFASLGGLGWALNHWQ
jgi:hypothetical protein